MFHCVLCKQPSLSFEVLLKLQLGDSYTMVLQVNNLSVNPFFGAQSPGLTALMSLDLEINFSCSPASTLRLIDATLGEMHQLQVSKSRDKV